MPAREKYIARPSSAVTTFTTCGCASEIGRASCRERVQISVVAVSLQKKRVQLGGAHGGGEKKSQTAVAAAAARTRRAVVVRDEPLPTFYTPVVVRVLTSAAMRCMDEQD